MAGGFGIIHDQVTYTISPEYFTRMKFDQFRSADFGFPPRVFVAEIGFLATWWVGLISGWFLARLAIPRCDAPTGKVLAAMLVIMTAAVSCGIIGGLSGPFFLERRTGWRESMDSMGVTDHPAFLRVAGIHLGSYAGALFGWIFTMWRIARIKRFAA